MRNAKQIQVKARPTKDKRERDFQFNKMLKKWKRKYQEFGIREELIKRQEFIKPSMVKKIKRNETLRQHYRDLQNLRDEGLHQ